MAAKTVTYIAGSETLYALQANSWTIEGAQLAAFYGAIGAGFDVGASSLLGPPSPLSKIYPSKGPLGYLPRSSYDDLLSEAAKSRAGAGAVNAFTGIVSGVGSTITTWLTNLFME